MKFYVSKSGQRYGPYSLEALRREVLANVFRPEHFASSDNGRTWEPISAVPGIGPLVYAVDPAVERCSRDIASSLTLLRPDFRLLADFTDLEAMDVACEPHLEHIVQLCGEKGVSAVVRAIPDPRRDIGQQIMSYFHYGPEVRVKSRHILKEAQEVLAGQTHHPAPNSSE